MLSNEFWCGFLLGLTLVTATVILVWTIARLRAKSGGHAQTPKIP
jgi:hypothetical protein